MLSIPEGVSVFNKGVIDPDYKCASGTGDHYKKLYNIIILLYA